MGRLMGKPTFCIGENKDADQLRGNREADQRLCFRYTDSTIPLLIKSNTKFQASSHLLCLYSPVCVRPVHKTTLLVFPRDGSYYHISFSQSVYLWHSYSVWSRVMSKPTMWFPNRSDTNRIVQALKIILEIQSM